MTANIVGERQGSIGNLAIAGSALELQHVFVDHADAGRAGGMAESLEATIGIDGEISGKFEATRADVVRGRALGAEAEIFVAEKFGEGEAVVELGHVDLARGVADARHGIDLLRRPGGGLPGKEVVVWVFLGVGSGLDRDSLDEHSIVAPGPGQVGSHDHRGGGPIGLGGTIVETEGP